MKNQCDGCLSNFPVKEGIHYCGSKIHTCCTMDVYFPHLIFTKSYHGDGLHYQAQDLLVGPLSCKRCNKFDLRFSNSQGHDGFRCYNCSNWISVEEILSDRLWR